MASTFLDECLAILSRTPRVMDTLLRDLGPAWTDATEGPGTWSPWAVVGHLIHAEKTDWIPRLDTILKHGISRPFEPFDREAQFRESAGKQLNDLLDEFAVWREKNLAHLRSLNLCEAELSLRGLHPELGQVTARQLIANWTAHDLAHLVQINRTMARRYRGEVGPWTKYLSVMAPRA
jgi:hypothetical protein